MIRLAIGKHIKTAQMPSIPTVDIIEAWQHPWTVCVLYPAFHYVFNTSRLVN